MIKAVVKEKGLIPFIGTMHSAGADLRIPYDVILPPGETQFLNTGVRVEIPEQHLGLIIPRSSLGKRNLMLSNTVGVIDSDYRGDLKILLKNVGNETQLLYKYDRVVQLIIIPYISPKLTFVDSLEETERGEKGFGSTGEK